eukprot:228432_1
MERISKWNELTSFPFKHVPPPFGGEHQQFMIATSQHNSPSTESDGNSSSKTADGIYKFNTQQNKWIKIWTYDREFLCDIYSTAYDNKNKLLYVCDTYTRFWNAANAKTSMIIFNFKTNTTTVSTDSSKQVYSLIFVDNKLHK